MPALSPTMTEGSLNKWLVKVGDRVKAGDVLAEIETDKATMEVEAVDEGLISKILIKEGTKNVSVNSPIALIQAEGDNLESKKIRSEDMQNELSDIPNISKKEDPIKKVLEATKLTKSNVLLKGSKTILGSYDKKIIINSHSSPELATIGSGDVLSGILVSLIGEKKMNPFLAGCSAVWLHGDIAKNYGKGLIAEDIVKGIPQALKRLEKWKIY